MSGERREPSPKQQVERAGRFGHNFATLPPGQAPIQRMMGLRRRRGFQLEENQPPPAAPPRPRAAASATAAAPTSILSTARTVGGGITGVSSGAGMLNSVTGIGGGVARALAPIAAPISSALSLVQAPETASAGGRIPRWKHDDGHSPGRSVDRARGRRPGDRSRGSRSLHRSGNSPNRRGGRVGQYGSGSAGDRAVGAGRDSGLAGAVCQGQAGHRLPASGAVSRSRTLSKRVFDEQD